MPAPATLFLQRDGALLRGTVPPQTWPQLQFAPQALPVLADLASRGYQPVLLGQAYGEPADAELMRWLETTCAEQGVAFRAALHGPLPAALQPGSDVQLLGEFLRERGYDRDRSRVIGDGRMAPVAQFLGLPHFSVADGGWPAIGLQLRDMRRHARIVRRTAETAVTVEVDLDREGPQHAATGLGFFDHMLEQLGRHGGFALDVQCVGDLHIDEHHTVEDCALTLGSALDQALGERRGIGRYGFLLPMDDTRAQAAIDLGGRPYSVFRADFPREQVGDLATEMVPHFFRSLAETLRANIHVEVAGDNTHHMIEASFKAVGRALRQAIARQGLELPSTKGSL